MQKELLKLISALILNIAIIVGVIYFVGFMARFVGIKRAILPQFVSDIIWYRLRLGGFNLVDYTKLGAFAFLLYFPFVIYANILSAKFFPPSVVALRSDIALTKLAKVEEKDIQCFQIAPDCISIRHSARATFPWTWYKANEMAIELPVGVDFTLFEFRQNSEVRAYFQYGISNKIADILIEKPGGQYQVVKGNGGKYVYAIGDNADLEKCDVLKIGFVEKFEHIEDRLKEAARWKSPMEFLLVAIPVNGRQDETVIHRKIDEYRLRDPDEAGRELFANGIEVRAMVQGWIDEMQANRQTS